MVYVKGKTQLPDGVEERVLAELDKYRLIRERTVAWEKLDEDREGEDTYEDVYSLTDTENCPFTILIMIDDDDYSFTGIILLHKSTTSWNAGLDKTEESAFCTLYADGRKEGDASSHSTSDSPNNFYDVTITYSLRRID